MSEDFFVLRAGVLTGLEAFIAVNQNCQYGGVQDARDGGVDSAWPVLELQLAYELRARLERHPEAVLV